MPTWQVWTYVSAFTLIGLFTTETIWDILPTISNVVLTFVFNMKDMKKLRLYHFIPSLLLFANDILVKAYANAIEDGFEATFLAVMIALDCVRSHGFKTKIKSATRNKFHSRILWQMGVKFNLQSNKEELETGDNQELFANKEAFVPMVFLKRETPIPPS